MTLKPAKVAKEKQHIFGGQKNSLNPAQLLDIYDLKSPIINVSFLSLRLFFCVREGLGSYSIIQDGLQFIILFVFTSAKSTGI